MAVSGLAGAIPVHSLALQVDRDILIVDFDAVFFVRIDHIAGKFDDISVGRAVDLFLQPGYGSVMLQDMKGYWKNENTNAQIETNGVYNGPLPLQNYGSSANGPNYSEPSSGLIIKNRRE